jgi:hypothetical protein
MKMKDEISVRFVTFYEDDEKIEEVAETFNMSDFDIDEENFCDC